MYLSVTQILKRLGKARNKKNANIVRDYLKTSGEVIGGVFRVEEEVFEEYFGEIIELLDKPKTELSKTFPIATYEAMVLNQQMEIADLKFRLEKAESAISNIIEIFYNVNKLKGE